MLIFFDDILVYSKCAKRSKCVFAVQQISYLGHIINNHGLSTDPAKISAVKGWPIPKNVTQLSSFLGLVGYYRRFVKYFGIISRPLYDALKKNSYIWGVAQQEAFDKLKSLLCSTPILTLPNFSQPFVLETDASGIGIGAVLMQGG